MAIDLIKIKDKLEGFKREPLNKGTNLNNKISFYCELHTDIKAHPYYTNFKKHIKNIYRNSYKEDMFINTYMGENPPSIEVCETVFSGLSDIFDSQNQNINIEVEGVSKSEVLKELEDYFEYFKTDGWNYVQTLFNSFICVDIKDNKPFVYNIAPEYVYYYEFDQDNKLKEIIFSFDKKDYYYYTDEYYSTWVREGEEYFIKTTNEGKQFYYEHGFKRCPVDIFLHTKLNTDNNILRKNIILPQFDALQKYVIKATELYISEFKAANYITVSPDNSCGYNTNSEICKGGKLYGTNVDIQNGGTAILLEDGTQKLCPSCGYNRHIGAGASITVDFQKASDAGIDINSMYQYYLPPLDGVEYQKEKLKNLKLDIIENSIGIIKKDTKEARNEIDIKSDYESRTKVLTSFGEDYAKTMEFVFEIVLKHLYKDKYKYTNVFLGNKFYLLTKEELLKEKAAATNPIERADIERKIVKLDYKHDANKLKLVEKIYEQMPYNGITDTDFFELIKLEKVTDFDVELRNNIVYYIEEFTRIYKNSLEVLDYNFINKKITELVNIKLEKDGTE